MVFDFGVGRRVCALRLRRADDCWDDWGFGLKADSKECSRLGGDLARWWRYLSPEPVDSTVCGALPRVDIYVAGSAC